MNQNAQKKTQTAKPMIALVNEDQSGTFNGTKYNFGQSFVNLVSNDSKYNWQVVSRSVANRAYSDRSVGVNSLKNKAGKAFAGFGRSLGGVFA